jgi:hypothetical protein
MKGIFNNTRSFSLKKATQSLTELFFIQNEQINLVKIGTQLQTLP